MASEEAPKLLPTKSAGSALTVTWPKLSLTTVLGGGLGRGQEEGSVEKLGHRNFII